MINGLGFMVYGYGFNRIYDARIAKFLSVDPLASKYPAWSPYVFVYNNPLKFIDPDGREGIVVSGSPGEHKNRKHFLVNRCKPTHDQSL